MQPGVYHIVTAADSLFNTPFRIASIANPAGYTARLAIWANWGGGVALHEATTANGGMTMAAVPAAGTRVTPRITATQMTTLRAALVTAGIVVSEGGRVTGVYELSITPPAGAADARVWLRGPFTIEGAPG